MARHKGNIQRKDEIDSNSLENLEMNSNAIQHGWERILNLTQWIVCPQIVWKYCKGSFINDGTHISRFVPSSPVVLNRGAAAY